MENLSCGLQKYFIYFAAPSSEQKVANIDFLKPEPVHHKKEPASCIKKNLRHAHKIALKFPINRTRCGKTQVD